MPPRGAPGLSPQWVESTAARRATHKGSAARMPNELSTHRQAIGDAAGGAGDPRQQQDAAAC